MIMNSIQYLQTAKIIKNNIAKKPIPEGIDFFDFYSNYTVGLFLFHGEAKFADNFAQVVIVPVGVCG